MGQYRITSIDVQFLAVSGRPRYHGGSSSPPGQCVWDLWWEQWFWNKFSRSSSGFRDSIILPGLHTHTGMNISETVSPHLREQQQ